jgi:hypothetical protein
MAMASVAGKVGQRKEGRIEKFKNKKTLLINVNFFLQICIDGCKRLQNIFMI